MRDSFTSQAAAEQHGLATGYRYWFGRPRAAELPYNRGLVPAGYLISSAADMTHYLLSHLNGGRYQKTMMLSAAGVDELHRRAIATPKPARPTAWAGSSGRSTGSPRSTTKARRSTSTPTPCSCPRAGRE